TRPVVPRPEAADRRWSRRPRGPWGARSSIRPAPNTSSRPPSAPHPAAPPSVIGATTRVHTTASIASAIPRTRGTGTPRWFSTRSRPHLIGARPSGSSQHPRQDGLRDVPALPTAMEEPPRGPVRRLVLETVDRDLDHPHTLADRGDGHPGLGPRPSRERPHRLHRMRRERALTGQRLGRAEPGLPPDQAGSAALHEAEPPRAAPRAEGDARG